jgi:calcineurin-like phosphoesterase
LRSEIASIERILAFVRGVITEREAAYRSVLHDGGAYSSYVRAVGVYNNYVGMQRDAVAAYNTQVRAYNACLEVVLE